MKKKIRADVRKAVSRFVNDGVSFSSLDVYAAVGGMVGDEEYPIHTQVWDMLGEREYSKYLSEFVRVELEYGGYANVWRYYKPKEKKETYYANVWSDKRMSVPMNSIRHFQQLEVPLYMAVTEGKITLSLEEKGVEIPISGRVKIAAELINSAGFGDENKLEVNTYSNRIEIVRIR